MSQIVLSGREKLESDFCHPVGNGEQLSFTLYGVSAKDAASLLDGRPELTGTILFRGVNGYERSYSGYTALDFISRESGHLRIMMRKEI